MAIEVDEADAGDGSMMVTKGTVEADGVDIEEIVAVARVIASSAAMDEIGAEVPIGVSEVAGAVEMAGEGGMIEVIEVTEGDTAVGGTIEGTEETEEMTEMIGDETIIVSLHSR